MAKIVTITNPLTGQPAQVDQLDHTAQQIDDGLNIARGVSNPNLLDNWYFSNPVDQRQGRVVVPNTTYYSDNTLTTSAGTTSAYVTAYRYATGTANGVNYASFKLTDSDTAPTYYAAPENVVRGYAGAGYGIDRWRIGSAGTLTIEDGYITFASSDATLRNLEQVLETLEVGKYTISILAENAAGANLIIGLVSGFTSATISTNEKQVVSLTFDVTTKASGTVYIQTGNSQIKLYAAKLELGSQQTLAHQENGVWVLNEIPDYGEQLARCQRYFQTFATESLRPTNALDFRPVMRTITALSTITVGGKTLYTAIADL